MMIACEPVMVVCQPVMFVLLTYDVNCEPMLIAYLIMMIFSL